MRRNAIVTLAALTAVLIFGVLVGVPAYVSSGVEDDLTRGGGRAHVKVSGSPFSLVDDRGGSIDVSASGLKLDMPGEARSAFDAIAGYDKVSVDLRDVQSGPYAIKRIKVDRDDAGAPYRLKLDAKTVAQKSGEGDSFMGALVSMTRGDLAPSFGAPVKLKVNALVGDPGEGDVEVIGTRGDDSVRVKAVPAFTAPEGPRDSIEVNASGLDLAVPADDGTALDGLEGYEEVHADLRDVHTGPFDVKNVRIDRTTGGDPYLVALDATANPQDLGDYTVDDWGDSWIGDLISRVEGNAVTSSDEPVNLSLTARVTTTPDGGANVEVISGGADGLDRDAIARALTSAVLARL
ncbi:MAG: hypothetical protein ABWZ63_08555 [Thermoleophilaceae bacterium]